MRGAVKVKRSAASARLAEWVVRHSCKAAGTARASIFSALGSTVQYLHARCHLLMSVVALHLTGRHSVLETCKAQQLSKAAGIIWGFCVLNVWVQYLNVRQVHMTCLHISCTVCNLVMHRPFHDQVKGLTQTTSNSRANRCTLPRHMIFNS